MINTSGVTIEANIFIVKLCSIDSSFIDLRNIVIRDQMDFCADRVYLESDISNHADVVIEGKSVELLILNDYTGNITLPSDIGVIGEVSISFHKIYFR